MNTKKYCRYFLNDLTYLQNSTHPLEAVLLTSIRPLLCHNHYPLIIKHRHWEHSNPAKIEWILLFNYQNKFLKSAICEDKKCKLETFCRFHTFLCKLFWQALLLKLWPPGHLHYDVARSQSGDPRSSQQQRRGFPVEKIMSLCNVCMHIVKKNPTFSANWFLF